MIGRKFFAAIAALVLVAGMSASTVHAKACPALCKTVIKACKDKCTTKPKAKCKRTCKTRIVGICKANAKVCPASPSSAFIDFDYCGN